MEELLFLPVFASIIITLVFLPAWIRKARQINLVWEDMNQYGHPKNLPGAGGIIVLMAFVLSVLIYVAIKTFILKTNLTSMETFALLTTTIIAGIIGFVDDILGWVRGGLRKRLRVILVIMAAIPLMVINAGESSINLPILGLVNTGWVYPLILIPIGVAGVTTTYNFLAGFKGLEAGQGIIILTFLSLIAYLTDSSWLALIGLCMVASLIVFYFFNIKAATILPGDALTYSVGALIASMAIIGNFERIAIVVFLPYITEFILKLRGKLKKQSFGIPNKDGSLEMPYDKIYGLTHVSLFILKKLKKKVYEKDIPRFIFCIQIILCLLALIIFRNSLFVL